MDPGEPSACFQQENQEPEVSPISTAKVTLYSTETCGFCTAAKMLLKKKDVDYDEVLVSRDAEKREEMMRLSGRRTVPQIFIDGRPIGGFDELYALDRSGELDKLLGMQVSVDTN